MPKALTKEDRIYLMSPYTSDRQTEVLRYKLATEAAAILIQAGYICFSPIVHSHPIALERNIQQDGAFWMRQCRTYIRHWATQGIVLMLPGWEESDGVDEELRLLIRLDLPVHYHTTAQLKQYLL